MKGLMIKSLALVVVFVFLAFPAFADRSNPPGSESVNERLAVEGAAVESVYGSCSGCYGWVWCHVKEAWRYVSGSEERIWCYFVEDPTAGTRPDYTRVGTGDTRHLMFIEGASSGHWIGIFWESSSVFSNLRLWYY